MKNSLKFIAPIAMSSLVLSACQDQYGNTNNTATGALLGAATGAAAGYLTSGDGRGDKAQGAIIGGTMGAMAGGGIGYTLDQQEAALRGDLAGTGALITNTGNRLVVTLPEAITFPVDGTTVKPSMVTTLGKLAQNLNQYPSNIVQVVGHTDSTGSESYNQNLSERRAQSVGAILRSNGVPSSRIQTVGMGEAAPIASNDTEAGRQNNRRVEINIIPVQ